MQWRLVLVVLATAAESGGACNSEPSTFWNHSKCKDPSSCCTTFWSSEGADDCCQTCGSTAGCAAWEWYGDYSQGPACYLCSKEVLQYRERTATNDALHVTGFGQPQQQQHRRRVGDAWGTNIHWTQERAAGEAAMLARAFKLARMDFHWSMCCPTPLLIIEKKVLEYIAAYCLSSVAT